MTISSGTISDSEMAAILSLAQDEEGFSLALLRLNQDERIPKFLDLLDSYDINNISTKYTANILNALIDSADLFPEGDNSAVSFNIPMRIHRIIQQLLKRYETSDERFNVFYGAINKSTKSIYIIVHELSLHENQQKENEDTFIPIEYRDFNPLQFEKLKELTVKKIKYWAEVGRLIEHPKLLRLLFAWKAWGDELECKQFVAHAVKNDQGLLAFLIATLDVPIHRTMTKLAKGSDWIKYMQNIEDFISSNDIKAHAVAMFESDEFEKLRENEQLALLIFLDLIKAETTKTMHLDIPQKNL
jgi:predicted KAP-like P-loop ATPase